ncbi:hypothetical protein ACFQZ4_02330 [Catellatospora coxensis]|uniref:Uncharacterized protein n=1 Tax=Catellatospora coxensis TaxID=310354 RepID=A0A8J3PBY7_9ACTN|nr:hypothetical protein [Catellatospora coxensis]GIG09416.1 hypothetical protein Cco03nite_61160 [Catellatospora coxensis]
MDEVAFFTHPNRARRPGASRRRWGIRVNGDDLRLLAAEATRDLWLAELSSEDHPELRWRFVLDQHCDLWASELATPSRLLFGEPDDDHRRSQGLWDGRVPLLGCASCGDWECWPLLAMIRVDEDTVVWSAFVQPHRKQWGELPIGPYTFDRAAYEATLAEPEALDADPGWAWSLTGDDPQT